MHLSSLFSFPSPSVCIHISLMHVTIPASVSLLLSFLQVFLPVESGSVIASQLQRMILLRAPLLSLPLLTLSLLFFYIIYRYNIVLYFLSSCRPFHLSISLSVIETDGCPPRVWFCLRFLSYKGTFSPWYCRQVLTHLGIWVSVIKCYEE